MRIKNYNKLYISYMTVDFVSVESITIKVEGVGSLSRVEKRTPTSLKK